MQYSASCKGIQNQRANKFVILSEKKLDCIVLKMKKNLQLQNSLAFRRYCLNNWLFKLQEMLP